MENLVVVPEERTKEMQEVDEKILSLNMLVRTLASDNDLFQENSDLYKKILEDHAKVVAEYKQKWADLIDDYNLNPEIGDKYVLNFYDNTITIADETLI